ncbi:outer membrane beta-barrel protein [Fulvivirga lutimaris]|uniref:outer membrane beta-barrel protein n=1 Tax=Fulvivirga lutimaris TaxID=1819566 RepID=UPI0012BCE464|nr:outer membrane beta-barrel protein [Fulvivirga lutimaris]MTI40126.1 hypothetical protein [Fulvivirga lutimaris]
MIRNFTTALFINFLMSVSIVSFGQTEKGNMLLGGGIDLGSTTYRYDNFEDQKVFSLNINPGLSYLLTDNVALGIILPISFSNQTQNGLADRKSQSLAFGPKLRYYIPFDRWAVFPEIEYTMGIGQFDTFIFDTTAGGLILSNEKYSTSNLSIGAGLTYFLSQSIAVESILSYNKSYTNYDSDGLSDLETTSIGFGVGFQIYFQTKK